MRYTSPTIGWHHTTWLYSGGATCGEGWNGVHIPGSGWQPGLFSSKPDLECFL